MGDVLVAEVVLNRPRVLPVVGQQVRTRLATVEAPAPRASTVRDLERRLRVRLQNWKGVLRRQTPEAWPLLGRLLVGRLTFTPHPDQRLYTFSGKGTLGGLVAGAAPSLAMVTPAGFEPAISTLKGLRPRPG